MAFNKKNRKRITLIAFILLLGTAYAGQAQGIFNQGKTLLKRYVKQIVLLKTYSGYLKKGYKIINGGLHTIGKMKNEEFSLHDTYYNSLQLVNPKINQYGRVQQVRKKVRAITRICNTTLWKATTSGLLRQPEQEELKTTMHKLLREVRTDMDKLELLLTNGKLKMTDEERLLAIDHIWQSTEKHLLMALVRYRQVKSIITNRQNTKQESNFLNKWYGVPPVNQKTKNNRP